ncbi:hypothetical protein METBIDRAFT_44893 [Metschnikowia bicuspidata var. bicuspidata NRRL YB-4993]|uniref:Uncharacterized protein n=1 Tax=Metschnikowia bicuspidata var. bicuspidata NRRL YB-4993 TaxID=869754 RepID=A0A1A0H768_9ASCO|nr:hypothetical protein METBIDRAFT_44893 [Metschnikowia bicuspidata var. bicuspidata NRRL YB-4993]OBA19871.1 hypothetical protein METBIDRAFT_44893 [Metschnikowia bicuspidata var. bicuspidata NRRL YB-4993]
MTEASTDDTLQMFFNEEFSPASYVDALYLLISGHTDRYSTQKLGTINTKTQELLTHLDYNTSELLHELEKKMELLKKLLSPIGVSEYVLAEESLGTAGSDTSRLQYYVASLKNAVETLSADVAAVKHEAGKPAIDESLEAGHADPVDALILLKQVKARILAVYHVIQNAQRTVSKPTESVILDDEFLATLLLLHESLRSRLREGGDEERAEVSDTVRELRSWVPMFQPFTRFGPPFVKFVVKMENEL